MKQVTLVEDMCEHATVMVLGPCHSLKITPGDLLYNRRTRELYIAGDIVRDYVFISRGWTMTPPLPALKGDQIVVVGTWCGTL